MAGLDGSSASDVDLRGFDEYVAKVRKILEDTAKGKGYSDGNPDSKNELYEFVNSRVAPGDGHALGEIVYKLVRYKAKRDPVDLVKIASWAFLAWKHR